MNRSEILATANMYINKDRAATHGDAEDSFGAASEMWSAYLTHKLGVQIDIDPADVCALMSLLKIVRVSANPSHLDSWVDIAGYAALGGELSAKFTEAQ
jgi:hypothetical protein